jgi:hypothetical protein
MILILGEKAVSAQACDRPRLITWLESPGGIRANAPRLIISAFGQDPNLSFSVSTFGDDMDDTADNVRSIERTLTTREDLNALDVTI